MTNAESTFPPPRRGAPTAALDPGMVRAGAAAAARRRELNISQRSLAADGIINAGALIAFEKGRSWPRERTRARLDQPAMAAGDDARRRRGDSATRGEGTDVPSGGTDEVPLIAQAIVAAVRTFGVAVDSLPAVEDPDFTARVTAILADLRKLEAVAARATRISKSPTLIKALSTVRRRYDDVMVLAATAPVAMLDQRLYAPPRRGANLTIGETAQAAGVSEDTIVRAEAEEPVSAEAVQRSSRSSVRSTGGLTPQRQ